MERQCIPATSWNRKYSHKHVLEWKMLTYWWQSGVTITTFENGPCCWKKVFPLDPVQHTVLGDVSDMDIAGFLHKTKQYLLAQNSAEKNKCSQFVNETYDPITSAGIWYRWLSGTKDFFTAFPAACTVNE